MTERSGWSLAACLRWPDIDTRARLPKGWTWDGSCTSVVNSDGTAADPARELVRIGGALVTAAATTPSRLTEAVAEVWERLKPGANYRTHLTVTVRAPGIGGDLAGCRRIVSYTRLYLPNLWPAVDPLDGLLRGLSGENALAHANAYMHGEMWRARRELVGLPRHRARSATKTLPQFVAAGAVHDGGPECVALLGDGSLSVSCLAGPRSPAQFHAAVLFAQLWVEAALTGADPLAVVAGAGPLARQQQFDVELEEGWRRTNVRYNAREAVAARLRNPRAPDGKTVGRGSSRRKGSRWA